MRQKLNLILIAVAIAAAAMTGCKEDASAGSTNSGELAARVGSAEIALSKVDRVIEQGLQGLGKKISDLSPVELAAARLQAIDTLITEEVLYQRSKQENLQISDEDVRTFIQKLVQQSGLSEDDYQKKLKEAGLTETEYREENRRKLAIEKLQDKLSAVKSPTDREIEDYFKANEQQFKVGRGVNLSWIVVDAVDNKAKNDAIGNDQAQQKINSIYAQLKGGADFATVARAQSEHESAYRSGDLGFLDEGRLAQAGFPPPLVQTFFGMKEGDITPPVQGSEGRYYIFKLTAKRTQEEQLTLDNPQVKAQISQALIGQRKEILNSALLSAALHQFKIENYLAQRMLQNPDNFGSLRPTALPANSGAKSDAGEKKAEPPVKEPPQENKTESGK